MSENNSDLCPRISLSLSNWNGIRINSSVLSLKMVLNYFQRNINFSFLCYFSVPFNKLEKMKICILKWFFYAYPYSWYTNRVECSTFVRYFVFHSEKYSLLHIVTRMQLQIQLLSTWIHNFWHLSDAIFHWSQLFSKIEIWFPLN